MSKNSIQVAIKVRPLLRKEKDQTSCWRVVGNSITLADTQSEPYYFDHIFDYNATNEMIFNTMAKHIIHAGIRGFNGTIFAYGQTSSGKTYTMMGDEENPGVMVLAAKEIFKEIEVLSDRQFLLRVGYIEIYNEKICDLLNKKNQDLKIHETTIGVSVNCEEKIITSEEELLSYLSMGNKERTVGETNMNERSSRSHAIFRIIIESRKLEDDTVIHSVLNLVDLAGSERADQTGATGTRLKEGGHINKSLLFLSNVIKRLSEQEEDKYISYRDSKLTRILQASLGGNAVTSIICTITPTSIEETQSTLSFAMRAKTIKNKPEVNEIVSDATMMKRLERQIKELEARLEVEKRKNESQIEVCQLEKRIKSEFLKIISSNSLHNVRALKEKRRRTWAPSGGTHMTASVSGSPPELTTNSETKGKTVRFTPCITVRPTIGGNDNGNPSFDMRIQAEVVEEDFQPAEEFFNQNPVLSSPPIKANDGDEFQTPKGKRNAWIRVSDTPSCARNIELGLQMIESAYNELQEFTNLEKKMDVKHDVYRALREQLDTIAERNLQLERERVELLNVKDELDVTKQQLDDSFRRSDQLSVQVSRLTQQNHEHEQTIEGYKRQIDELTATIKTLQLNNQELAGVDIECQSNKNKFKLREGELLDALAEKDQEIDKLTKTLASIRRRDSDQAAEKLQRTTVGLAEPKQPLRHLTLCGDHDRHDDIVDDANVDGGEEERLDCDKCSKRQEQQRAVEAELERLTLECERLRADCENGSRAAAIAQVSFEKLLKINKEASDAERTTLSNEIVVLRGKLKEVQDEYCFANSENSLKGEQLHKLKIIIAEQQEEMRMLQDKYDRLEAEQASLAELQVSYNEIQRRYVNLQSTYAALNLQSEKSGEVCKSLQKENEHLQDEIGKLKQQLESAETEFKNICSEAASDATTAMAATFTNESLEKVSDMAQELAELRAQCEALQKENDSLSSTLMEGVEESDMLKRRLEESDKKRRDLEAKIDEHEDLRKSLNDEMASLKAQLESLLASGIIAKTTTTIKSGRCTSMSIASDLGSSDSLRSSVELDTHRPEVKDNYSQSEIIGYDQQKELDSLRQRIVDLTKLNEQLQSERKALVESTEKTIQEMRESIKNLSNELFEKSMTVESLERERAEVTFVCEELQKMTDITVVEASEVSLIRDLGPTEDELKNELKAKTSEIQVQSDLIGRLRDHCADLQSLKTQYEERIAQMKVKLDEVRDERDQSRLELLEKLESDEGQFRENLRKYNYEWELSKQNYEKEIARLEEQLRDASKTAPDPVDEYEKRLQAMHEEIENIKNRDAKSLSELRETITKLEGEKTDLEVECGGFKALLQEQQEITAKLEQEKREVEMKFEQLRNAGDLEEERKTWQESRRAMEEEIANLTAARDEALNEQRNQQEQLCKCQAMCQNLQDTQDKQLELLQERLEMFVALTEEHDRLKEKLAIASAEVLQLRTEKKERSDKDDQLIKGLEEKVQMLEKNLADGDMLQKNFDKIFQENAEIKEALAVSRRRGEELVPKLLRTVEEKRSCEQKLNAMSQKVTQSNQLIESLQAKLAALESISDAKERAGDEIESIRCTYEKRNKKLQLEKDQLSLSLEQQKEKERIMGENIQTLEHKILSLNGELDKAKERIKVLAEKNKDKRIDLNVLKEHATRQIDLTKEMSTLASLVNDGKRLEHSHLAIIESQTTQIGVLEQQLSDSKKKLEDNTRDAEKQRKQLECQLQAIEEERSQLQKKCCELQSSVDEFRFKCDSLEKCLKTVQDDNKRLEWHLKSTITSANSCKALQEQLDEQKALYEKLEEEFKQQSTDKISKDCIEQLEQTVSRLLHEKKALEDRLSAIEIGNRSATENSLGTPSPSQRRSEDQLFFENSQIEAINVDIADVLSAKQIKVSLQGSTDRKNRRLSAHDERRRQSYWPSTRDLATMTDPMETACKCIELDEKLKACERNLFIRDSQVSALRLELKNHPLKKENADLKKRLLDEREKHGKEIDHYKRIIVDGTTKRLTPSKTVDVASQTDSDVCQTLQRFQEEHDKHCQEIERYKEIIGDQILKESAPSTVVHRETQTTSDACWDLQILQGKYNDLKTICRGRAQKIRDLENQLNGEKPDENDQSLKSQCHLLEKELNQVKRKYTMAKQVLEMRRNEIQSLKGQLGSSPDVESEIETQNKLEG